MTDMAGYLSIGQKAALLDREEYHIKFIMDVEGRIGPREMMNELNEKLQIIKATKEIVSRESKPFGRM